MTQTTQLQPQANRSASVGVLAILGVSIVATLFLLWLLYVHHAPSEFRGRFTFLPALNAVLNGMSALCLMLGFIFVKQGEIAKHRSAMLAAFAFSSLFLVSYITNHAIHGDTLYPHIASRTAYLCLLASHVLLSVVALPVVLVTFFLSLSGRIALHRRVARWTFPLWLYVSVTGVIVYIMLHAAVGAAY